MNRILYLEGSSGISGDMTVSALLDLGASRKKMEEELKKLPLDGYRLIIGKTQKNGIEACAFYVELDDTVPQPMRNYAQIREMLMQSELDKNVKQLAIHIFVILAKAEAAVHGTDVEHVHFHEVGAVDSIVDIVAAAICFVDLGIEQVAVGTLAEGKGTTWCQHGRIPVPVPATCELLREYGLKIKILDVQGEMITPTGAAIAAALRNREMPKEYQIEGVGIGSGEKDFPHANILRAMILREKEEKQIFVLETNVDDCSGELLGYVQGMLLKAGALDVVYRPIYMKKNRPAYQLQIVCRKENIEVLEGIVFRETTTIGIREYPVERNILERKIETIVTPYGEVRVKICRFQQEEYRYPEYDDLCQYCEKSGMTFQQGYEKFIKKI